MKARRQRGLTASPILVGAVTVLVTCVAVFISYSANEGLPFLPTYDVKAQLPNGAKLVEGAEVRAGGFRVGQVTAIRGGRETVEGSERAIAVIEMELDKRVEPLPVDTALTVRSRSALGLKYVELVPGRAQESYVAGDTIPLTSASPPEDLEDVLSMFGPQTRDDARLTLQGFGDGLSGRGPALNRTVAELNPFLTRLRPVMTVLSDPDTELRRLIPALARTVEQAAPVAGAQARWITAMADTFAAVGRDPQALQETIEESPPTVEASIESLRVQTPFLARFADLSRRLRPAAAQLDRSLPLVNGALAAGIPALRSTPELSGHVEQLFVAVEDLGDNPMTLLALGDLRQAAEIARPAVTFLAPYQTVCNYIVYFFNPLGTHQSEAVPGGTAERILAKTFASSLQPNSLGTTQSTRPADVPANEDPQGETASGHHVLHAQWGGPAVDGRGRADCQAGQTGFINRLVTDGRWPPSNVRDPLGGTRFGGGNHVVLDPNTPGLAGGTFKARELGIRKVGDVP